MTTQTVTLIPDLQPSQGSKYIAITDAYAKIEGVAINYSRAEIVTTLPSTPVEGVAYLVNSSFSTYTPGSFFVYTKQPNSTSTTIVPQTYRGLPGMPLAGYRLDNAGLQWRPKTDILLYGTNTDTWAVDSYVIANAAPISLSGTSVIYDAGVLSAFPISLPTGINRVVRTDTIVYVN